MDKVLIYMHEHDRNLDARVMDAVTRHYNEHNRHVESLHKYTYTHTYTYIYIYLHIYLHIRIYMHMPGVWTHVPWTL
jgi:hypothetical protein